MNFKPIIESVGIGGVAVMAVCFFAVAWWGFRKPGRDGGASGGPSDDGDGDGGD